MFKKINKTLFFRFFFIIKSLPIGRQYNTELKFSILNLKTRTIKTDKCKSQILFTLKRELLHTNP